MTLPGLSRQYVKLCDLRDFDDPAVQERIDDIVPGLDPSERVHRKNWEYALLALFLDDAGLLGEETRILSVGAGHETVLFWLANRVAKVVATDIYGEGIFSGLEADRSMLTDPASFSPYPYRESHLEVRHMDAKQLEFEDGSFDAVFSLSSIEHFGSWADIRRSAEEMGRVLRPGGVAFVVTECFLGRSLLSPRAVQELGSKVAWPIRIFTPSLLRSRDRRAQRARARAAARGGASRYRRQRDRAARRRPDHVYDRRRLSAHRGSRAAVRVAHAAVDLGSPGYDQVAVQRANAMWPSPWVAAGP